MDGDYNYQPLTAPNNIRLLILQPAENLTDPLIGHLEQVNLKDASYTALSYSWAMEDDKGNFDERCNFDHDPPISLPCKPLLLEHVSVFIGENLHDALRRLREASPSAVRLWVDAICINQLNDAEKTAQVAIMSSIYTHATQVIAWLGEGNSDVNEAAKIGLQCLITERDQQTQVDFHDEPDSLHFQPWFFVHSWLPGDFRETACPPSSSRPQCHFCCSNSILHNATMQHKILQALIVLRSRRYHRRLWVIQELYLPSPSHISFRFGAHILPGNPQVLLRDRWVIHTGYVFPDAGWDLKPYNPRCKDRSFETWVEYGNAFLCRNPLDRPYALLGCCEVEVKITLDYGRTPGEAYRDFAKYLLEHHNIMAILSSVGMGAWDEGERFSSWVRDLGQHFYGKFSTISRQEKEAPWNYAQPSLSSDGEVLTCHLEFLGTVYYNNRDELPLPDARPQSGRCFCCQPAIAVNDIDSEYKDYIRSGDVLCRLRGNGYIDAELVLRPFSERPGFWKIVSSWTKLSGQGVLYRERRLYHII